MIYLLYGQDTYRSRAKLCEIIDEYRRKNEGVLDLYRFDATEDDPIRLRELATSQSLFVKKRLVVIERPGGGEFLTRLKDFLKETKSDPTIFVVLWSDKGREEAEAIRGVAEPLAAKAVEFAPMTRAQARCWLALFLEKEKLKVSQEDFRLLLDRFHVDTWRLANEAKRVAMGGDIAAPNAEADERFFALTDAFLLDAGASLKALQRVRANGTHDLVIFGGIAAHLRTLLVVSDGKHQKLHPFVLKKAREKITRLGIERIRAVYERMLEEDAKSKTGLSDPYSSLANLILSV